MALSACSGNAGNGNGHTITLLAHLTPTMPRSYWNHLAAMFHQQHADIDVKIEDTGTSSVADGIKPLLASGNAPDVVFGYPPSAQNYKQLLPLTGQSWLKDSMAFPAGWDIDGQQYAAALSYQVQSLVFYNKADFAKAGITRTPATLAEMTADLGKLKDAGLTPMLTGGTTLAGAQILQMSYPTVFGSDPNWYGDIDSGRSTIADSGMATILDAYAGWAHQGYIDKDSMAEAYDKTVTDFIAGKAAMYPMGSWVGASFTAQNASQFGVFAMPTVDGSITPPPLAVGVATWEVLKNTKTKDAAVEFVHWATTDKTAVQYYLNANGDFSTLTDYRQNSVEQQIQKLLNGAKTTPCCNGVGLANTSPSGLGSELTTLVQAILTGTSATDAVKQLQTYWDQNKPTS